MDASTIFTLIGIISLLALLPVLLLPEPVKRKNREFPPLLAQTRAALAAGSRTPGIWLSGSMEAGVFIALYTIKAFLPVYGLSTGINVALIGLFFSLQEAVHIFTGPAGGWFGQRFNYWVAIITGMVILAVGVALVSSLTGAAILLPALLLGLAQALIFPSTAALVTDQIPPENLGAGMGLVGMMENLGKVIGPVLCGALIGAFGFQSVLYGLAAVLLLAVAPLAIFSTRRQQAIRPSHT
jgi:MFS family permease